MNEEYPKAYAVFNKDEHIRFLSTSGGIFSLLAEYMIKNGAVVYGAAFDDHFSVTHIRVADYEGIAKLRGSKYPQSQVLNCYKSAKRDLDDGKTVFFTGTPCQIAGLKNFIGKNKNIDNLYTLDFVCHGVASDMLWRDYVTGLEKNGEIKNIIFKYKYKGWKKWYFRVDYKDGRYWQRRGHMTSFMNSYISYANIRPSCYECHFKGLHRVSDFTISDCWGIGEQDKLMNDNRGLSALLLQNERAVKIFEQISEFAKYKKYDARALMEGNWTTFKSVKPNKVRTEFFAYVNKNSGQKGLKKFFSPTVKRWIGYYIKRIKGTEK